MINPQQLRDDAGSFLTPNYGKRNIMLVRGEGSRVWDEAGREYLDFLTGISVNNLGHCHPAVVNAVQSQVAQFMHCSNLYLIPQQIELARRLCELSFADRAFFANSGAEVNEGAIKLARLYSKKKYGENRYEIITVRNSFHGRTMATLTATGQDKVQKGFEPLVQGFHYARLNDLESVLAQMSERTCAVMLEPVQGEGGIIPCTPEFLRSLRDECSKRDILLIFDEIQCGMGRCGKLFAYQVLGVEPDIMTLAKALGNGFPIGALLAREEVAAVLEPGTHGSTFGGGPLACAVALAVLETIVSEDVPALAAERGTYFRDRLKQSFSGLTGVKEVRGLGMMVGIELAYPGADVVAKCAEDGLLLNCTMGNVLRILPPLNATTDECDTATAILTQALAAEEEKLKQAPSSKKEPGNLAAPAGGKH